MNDVERISSLRNFSPDKRSPAKYYTNLLITAQNLRRSIDAWHGNKLLEIKQNFIFWKYIDFQVVVRVAGCGNE